MRYLLAIIFLTGFLITPAFAQEQKNPSIIIETLEIPFNEFNKISRDGRAKMTNPKIIKIILKNLNLLFGTHFSPAFV